ncbi:ATP-binding protein [Polluticoccus soli]|uniref:ATP-binding protein n=1 Tax=Polluticoccus soli TaxID=3034150 RepID=UPI0023E1C060|nr:ATP-binding protein [Flavipsychrobacter sp. JY13-12]
MATNIITPKFLEKMRSSDYQSTSYAFAEIIDNSFDADAKSVKIICIEKRDRHNKRYIDEIIFSDDGTGMTDHVLNNCLTFAYGTNEDLTEVVRKKKIGKFGMGLPNSSISQCKTVSVYSKIEGGEWRSKHLNIKELVTNDSTELPDMAVTTLPDYYNNIEVVINPSHGTIVSWRDCDRLDRQFADTLYKRSESILGRLFRHHLAAGCTVNLIVYLHNAEENSFIKNIDKRVLLFDPMFLTPNGYMTKPLREASVRDESIEERFDPAMYYRKFIAGLPENESLPTSERLEDHSYVHKFEWDGNEYHIRIKTSFAKLDIQKPGIREGGKTKIGTIYGEKMKNGNIYFTRHQREISCGHYGFYNLSAENNRWWTIELDFDATADDLLGVSNTKQGIKFTKTIDDESSLGFDKHTASLQQAREKLWFELSTKITKAIQAVSKILGEQAKQFEHLLNQDEDDDDTSVPTGTNQTTQAIKNTDKQRKGRFDDEQKRDLIDTLKDKFKTLTEEEVIYAVDKFDKSLVRGCVIYCPIDGSDQLWSYSEVRGFLVIFINTHHDFYNNIIAHFRTMKFESALTAIELFISSLAWEQNEHFDTDADKKRYLDNFRTYVGIHLKNYLQENDIKIAIKELENYMSDEVA